MGGSLDADNGLESGNRRRASLVLPFFAAEVEPSPVETKLVDMEAEPLSSPLVYRSDADDSDCACT